MNRRWQDAIGVANEVAEVYEKDPDRIIGIIKKAMDKARQDERKLLMNLLKDAEREMDLANGYYSEYGRLCLFCGAKDYDSKVGIIHRGDCIILRIRRLIGGERGE